MAATLRAGQRTWSATRDKGGHRHYKVVHLVVALATDGPVVIGSTPGLPVIGSAWNFDSDLDIWAWCTPEMKITPLVTNEPNTTWEVEQVFTTKIDSKRCQDYQIEDPLLEPAKVSGSFVRGSQPFMFDRNGAGIKSSSHEFIPVEFDVANPTVRIEQNVASLGLSTFAAMMNTVNDAALWGLSARMVKLSGVNWSRKVLGSCGYYYTRSFEFEVDYTTFDKEVADEGTKKLKDGGDKTNPDDFEQAVDGLDNALKTVPLDGNGAIATSAAAILAAKITVERYDESNFLTLGIPTVF